MPASCRSTSPLARVARQVGQLAPQLVGRHVGKQVVDACNADARQHLGAVLLGKRQIAHAIGLLDGFQERLVLLSSISVFDGGDVRHLELEEPAAPFGILVHGGRSLRGQR